MDFMTREVFDWLIVGTIILGFLLAAGFFERSLRAIALGVVTGLAYGGLLWGVLPTHPGISWESHLFGFLAGALAASWLSSRPAAAT